MIYFISKSHQVPPPPMHNDLRVLWTVCKLATNYQCHQCRMTHGCCESSINSTFHVLPPIATTNTVWPTTAMSHASNATKLSLAPMPCDLRVVCVSIMSMSHSMKCHQLPPPPLSYNMLRLKCLSMPRLLKCDQAIALWPPVCAHHCRCHLEYIPSVPVAVYFLWPMIGLHRPSRPHFTTMPPIAVGMTNL